MHEHRIAVEYPEVRAHALHSIAANNIPPAKAHEYLERDAYLMMLPPEIRELICPKLTSYHGRRQRASLQKRESRKEGEYPKLGL